MKWPRDWRSPGPNAVFLVAAEPVGRHVTAGRIQ
jgi:hypothetical protein